MNDSIRDQLLAQAASHLQDGRYNAAALCCQQVLHQRPGDPMALTLLGQVHCHTGLLGLAEDQFTAALAADPASLDAATNLANLYLQTNRAQFACAPLRAVTARRPDFPVAWLNLGNLLLRRGDYDEAIDAYRTAVRLRPDYVNALVYQGLAYLRTLRLDRALVLWRRALALDDTPESHSHFLFFGLFSARLSAAKLAASAVAWDKRFGAAAPSFDFTSITRDPERQLRVGYVAPTLRGHTIGLLVEPIVAGHDRAGFLPYCYSDVTDEDDVTRRFRASAHGYRATANLSDEQLAQVIRQDGIDILVDLNLHMEQSRLGVFTRRAAPLQVNYLAYPFTSGLRMMDYRVTDAVLDPPGEKPLGPEALLRLRTSFWLYRPNPAAPAPAERLPARDRRRLTFASLNLPQKLNPRVAQVWARILNQIPTARLLLFSDDPGKQQKAFARLFAAAGLDSTRLDLVGSASQPVHLARYRQADLVLDPIPYGGHTTTLDALWMGVPVLTLAGPAPYQRGAASILPRVGLAELVTHGLEEYEQTAIALAGDWDRLEALRLNLRGRMAASVLCDEKGFVADFERGLRLAWRRWCAGLPPAAIDLAAAQARK